MITKTLLCFSFSLFLFSSYGSMFTHALKDIKKNGNLNNYEYLKSDILYPYLGIAYYQKRLHLDKEIKSFLKKHGTIPQSINLHKKWILDLLKRKNYQIIINNYVHTADIEVNCAHRLSLYKEGFHQQALHQIKELWMSADSLPSSCNPVFFLWGKSFDNKLLTQRAKLAYLAENYSFAKQLASKASSSEAIIIEQFSSYAKNPRQLLNIDSSLLIQTNLHKELLPKALFSLAKKNSVKYAPFILGFANQLNNNKYYQDTLQSLAQYLSKRNDFLAKQTYKKIINPSKPTTEALIFFLLKTGDWQGIIDSIASSTRFDISKYWLAKSLEKNNQTESAHLLLDKLAESRSYYGFLAADQLNKTYQFNINTIQPNKKTQVNFNNSPGLKRALALKIQSKNQLASREIFHISKKIDTSQQQQLAFWLHNNQLYFDAIYLLGKQKAWNMVYTRFPTPYQSLIKQNSQAKQIDLTWIYAIIRQETSMNPNAISRSKAKGLMQLIPSTARIVAKQLGIYLNNNIIFEPKTNISLGSQYLRKMYDQYGNIALASAAYNAGPGRVNRWQQNGLLDMPLWIELIPFNETRKYVKRILEYQQVYAHLINIKQPRVTEIINR